MKSVDRIAIELRALQAVVTVLARSKNGDREFESQVIELINHIASDLPLQDAEQLKLSAQHLIHE